ncbi:GxxExxY protein [Cyclonatronum proteinivorum]|uniref:GxxExxY protein n=1 Tax=Cyclonatronum proteinivorum TaxID=1457365 RepID=A0A345UMG9_9BACT|nr:GxxExxY protein [Cyclonatronum proteinivorum]AXJ01671.1 GxxExxY protein [Cyclonatronum proteinivorum]
MSVNDLTYNILKCAYTVHSELGPGLLESAYEHALAFELIEAGFEVETQKALPLIYKGSKLDCGYRIDLLVNRTVIIELKTVEKILDIHKAQLLSYMKLSNIKYGLLINFNVLSLKNGIERLILTPKNSA